MPRTQPSRKSSQRGAFTLIELLVVIAIISLLVSILLPSLSAAKRTAMAVACGANCKGMAQAMQNYATEQDDWMIGSPNTTGRHISTTTASGAPTQIWDFMGPIADSSGVSLPKDRTAADTINRFNMIRNDLKQFHCPSNDFLATYFSGPNAGTGKMIAYNTSRYFMYRYDKSKTTDHRFTYNNDAGHSESIPTSWAPRLTRLGDTSKKVFIADGSRFATVDTYPDYDLSPQATFGGAFSDVSPYSLFSRSWDRTGRNTPNDARFYAFRHALGAVQAGAPANAFKLNVTFWDGHTELMGDVQSASPWMWLPAGSTLTTADMHEDVKQAYGIDSVASLNISS